MVKLLRNVIPIVSRLFTATSRGEASPSGGGTTNFLRADNTWANPVSAVADVKNGSIASISAAGTSSVVFTTEFANAPNVVVNYEGNVDHYSGEKGGGLSVYSISISGFTVRYDAASASQDPATNIQWIATDAGDP